jgi:hypothetical protein
MTLQAKTQLSVFIDSDSLMELDDPIDIVKSKVKHLVVYLTKDTLGQSWCAGEIATAFATSRVKVTAVRTTSFTEPTEDQMARIVEHIDPTSCALITHGISYDHVRDAYKRLLSTESPQVWLKDGRVRNLATLMDHICKELTDDSAICVGINVDLPPLPRGDLEGAVVISCDHEDMEAAAAANVLNTMIHEQVLSLTSRKTFVLQDFQQASPATYSCAPKQSYATITMMSQGSMKSAAQLRVITSIMSATAQRQVIVPVLIDGFRFPDDSYYNEELPKILPGLAEEARPLIVDFLNTIALPFSIGASDIVREIQSQKVLDRILKARARVLPRLSAASRLPSAAAPTPSFATSAASEVRAGHFGLPRLSAASRLPQAAEPTPSRATSAREEVISI